MLNREIATNRGAVCRQTGRYTQSIIKWRSYIEWNPSIISCLIWRDVFLYQRGYLSWQVRIMLMQVCHWYVASFCIYSIMKCCQTHNHPLWSHNDVIKWKHFPRYWPVPVNSPRPVTRSFEVVFELRLNKRPSKQWRGWWFETYRTHYDVIVMAAPWSNM